MRKLLTDYQVVLEWAVRKKGISEVLVRSAINLYEGEKTSQSGF